MTDRYVLGAITNLMFNNDPFGFGKTIKDAQSIIDNVDFTSGREQSILDDLKEQLKQKDIEIHNLHNSIGQLKQELKDNNIDEYKHKLANLESKNKELIREKEQLNNRNVKLYSDLQELNDRIYSLVKDNESIEKLRQELKDSNIDEYKHKLANLESKNKELIRENEQLNNSIVQLELEEPVMKALKALPKANRLLLIRRAITNEVTNQGLLLSTE